MKYPERIAPVAAVLGALTTVVCCLPVSLAGAAALGSFAAAMAPLRVPLLGLATVLVVVGLVQVNRREAACAKGGPRPWVSLVLLSTAAVVVLMVALFPQVIAGVLADWMP